MATITGFTASRMKEIEDASVVGGSVVGDDLILQRFDGTTFNAGVVKGATGAAGPVGEVSDAELAAAIAGVQSDIVASMPIGSITMFAGAAAPINWALSTGQTVSRTTYSDLFALIGTTYGSGDGSTTFNLPDFRNRFPAGLGSATWSDARGETGGSKDAIAVTHTHAIDHDHASASTSSDTHSHSANHNHTATTGAAGVHSHNVNTRDNMSAGGSTGDPMISNSTGTASLRETSSQPSHTHTVTVDTKSFSTGTDAHTHTLDLPSFAGTSGSGGSSGTDKNLPPYITINFIIKVL